MTADHGIIHRPDGSRFAPGRSPWLHHRRIVAGVVSGISFAASIGFNHEARTRACISCMFMD